MAAVPLDLAAIQAIVQAAVLAALQGQAPAAPQFAIIPAGGGNDPINMHTQLGTKIFLSYTEAFKELFNGEQAKLNDFNRQLYNRAETFGLEMVLFITDNSGQVRNMTREHGCLTLENVRAAAIVNLQAEGRAHQASEMLRKLIQASITAKLSARLHHRKDNYTVDVAAAAAAGQPANPPIMKEDGACMLFELNSMVVVETRSTVSGMILKLNNPTAIMESVKSNIEAFNIEIEDIVDGLNARNAPIPELLTNLFEGYKSCEDTIFVKYIEAKESDYEDGTNNLTSTQLMQISLEKYKVMQRKGVWMKKTDNELEFIAMKAQLQQLKNPVKKTSIVKKVGDGGKKLKGKDKYAWKNVPPKDGEPITKTMNGKKYIYCPHHHTTCWVLEVNQQGIPHRTGCRMMQESNAGSSTSTEAGQQGRFANALAHVMEEEGAENGEPDEENI